jgi:ectoine hydroxylase-related dioxygenase (phytanoyl-CoA dioxygenase family)
MNIKGQLENRGYSVHNYIYTKKEVNKIRKLLGDYQKNNPLEGHKEVYAIRNLLKEVPDLKQIILNHNVKTILNHLGENFHLTKALYFNKPALSNWYVTWHQDVSIHVQDKIDTPLFQGWTNKKGFIGVVPSEDISINTITIRIHLDDTTQENGGLKIIPGSNKEVLSDEKIKLITQNSVSKNCDVLAGGIQLMKPLLLHASPKSQSNKNRRVIHLEFNNTELPNGLEWAEREIV